MRPLVTSQRALTWLCLCPVAENVSKRMKLIYILFTCVTHLVATYIFICSTIYSIRLLRTDLEKSLYSLYQIAAASNMIYLISTVFFIRQKISDVFMQLSEIYQTSENPFDFGRMNMKYLFSNFEWNFNRI